MRSSSRWWIAMLAVGSLVAAGCGEADDPTVEEPTDEVAPDAAEDVDPDDDAVEDAEAPTDDPADDADDADEADDAAPGDGWAGEGGGDDGVLQVAFVYVGPVGDAGWTYAHDQGRQAMQEALGDRVETRYLESVEEGAPAERVFEDLAREGFDLVFGTSFGFMDAMAAVAPDYPDVVFEHCSGYTTGDNLGTYFGAMEEPRYLSGMAAGAVSESGRIGYVAAFPIPEVIRGINAFTLGAQETNPDATVEVVWTSTWYDPAVEKEAAESLLDRGVDVVAQHQDTPSPGQAAEERDAYWVGYNSDMTEFAPDAWLTAPVWDWGPYYVETAELVWDGTWEPREVYASMADGIVGLAPFGDAVDPDTQALVEERAEEIVDGQFAPFSGPISDQDGEQRVADGDELSLGELLEMSWFVQGVIGSPGE
jgi:basic membrane protein A and related proteins